MAIYYPHLQAHGQAYVPDAQHEEIARLDAIQSLFQEVDSSRANPGVPHPDSVNAPSYPPAHYPYSQSAPANYYSPLAEMASSSTSDSTYPDMFHAFTNIPEDPSMAQLMQGFPPMEGMEELPSVSPMTNFQQRNISMPSSTMNGFNQSTSAGSAPLVLVDSQPQAPSPSQPLAQPLPPPSPVTTGRPLRGGGPSRGVSKPPRLPSGLRSPPGRDKRACVRCKAHKAKCSLTLPTSSEGSCTRCTKYGHECQLVEPKKTNEVMRIKDLNVRIKEVNDKIQQRLLEVFGPSAVRDWQNMLDSTEGRKCDCPAPPNAAPALAEGSTAANGAAPAVIHRAGCPAVDPMGLYTRARLMYLLDVDDDDEMDSDELTTTSEEEAYHDASLSLPSMATGTPVAIFCELALSLGSPGSEHAPSNSPIMSHSSSDVGLASADYFTPSPATRPAFKRIVIERERLPSYLVNGTIRPAECHRLFALFMEKWNVSVSVLDPGLHTNARVVLARCPFLFTVVLAIAARDYPKPEYYPLLMQEAKTMAGPALVEWCKSIEIVQAFLLLAMFPAPVRCMDEDKTFSYLGFAIRMASDLELNRPAEHPFASEMAEREHLNRIRTWLICHNLDVSAAAKLGKPTTIQEDAVILGSRTWWKTSKFRSPFDIHLCAFTQILIIFHKYFRHLGADSSSLAGHETIGNIQMIIDQFTAEINDFQTEFERIFAEGSDPSNAACRYRAHVRYSAHYFRLVMYSNCHRKVSARDIRAGDFILSHCLDAASQLVKALSEHHANSEFFKYSAEGWFTFGAFAAAFVIKALRPAFSPVIDQSQRVYLRGLVLQLIDAYQSKKVAIDDNHTPSIYARFLGRLLNRVDELNGDSQAAQVRPARSVSPQIKADVDDVNELFKLPPIPGMRPGANF